MKKAIEHPIILLVIATGISSVVTQLLTIREFLTQFQGNEIVIALILFNWLILGGIGTLAARMIPPKIMPPGKMQLAWMSFCLTVLSPLQILAIRVLRDLVFIKGVSVGFYATLTFTSIIIAPYSLLLGFVLPYSFFTIRRHLPAYEGARIYIFDNMGDISGGALFSFALVFLVTPMQALLIANLPLLAFTCLLVPEKQRRSPAIVLSSLLVVGVLAAACIWERPSLESLDGRLAYYRESRYGRITVRQDRELTTLFQDGQPVSSSQNLILAEEAIHYPLSQLEKPESVLLISVQGGMMKELDKYELKTVDYVELDPAMTSVQVQFSLIEQIPSLRTIHRDGRTYLADTNKRYDAIIVNLPEPETFQLNRFYTYGFFAEAKRNLTVNGLLSFSLQGFDNYLAEPQRQKLSSLYHTANEHFPNILMLPGQKIFFLCSNQRLDADIPAALLRKGVRTQYIADYFTGNVSHERIQRLNQLIDRQTPKNFDLQPYLMQIMFSQWFAKHGDSPLGFVIAMSVLTLFYLSRISRSEFVLFTTGCMAMGSEILVIFAFQIFFGYIYLQIGIIITVFLAGLLPGAWLSYRLYRLHRGILAGGDGLLLALLGCFILAIATSGSSLPSTFFLVFGFCVSLICGFQFPAALQLSGGDHSAAARAFSADLLGAAVGTLLTSLLLIPYFGIIWATVGLMSIKTVSLLVISTTKTN